MACGRFIGYEEFQGFPIPVLTSLELGVGSHSFRLHPTCVQNNVWKSLCTVGGLGREKPSPDSLYLKNDASATLPLKSPIPPTKHASQKVWAKLPCLLQQTGAVICLSFPTFYPGGIHSRAMAVVAAPLRIYPIYVHRFLCTLPFHSPTHDQGSLWHEKNKHNYKHNNSSDKQ